MRSICFLIDHPFDLVLFLGLRNILKLEDKKIKIIAIITSHRYFDKCADCNSFVDQFEDVFKVQYPAFSKDIIKNIRISKDFIKIIEKIELMNEGVQFITANRSELTTQL